MLSRLIAKPSNLRFISLLSSHINRYNTLSSPPLHSLRSAYSPTGSPEFAFTFNISFENARCFSSKRGDGKDEEKSKLWKNSSGNEDNGESVFGENGDDLAGLNESFDVAGVGSRTVDDNSWSKGFTERGDAGDDVFRDIDKDPGIKNGADDNEWLTADGYKPWSFGDEVKADHIFDIGEERNEEEKQVYLEQQRNTEEEKQLEEEEQALLSVIKGPNRAFGDLIAASGITDEMLDSLIALKDLEGVEGLPPLREIEDMRYRKSTEKSVRIEMERQKQEEIAKARVRQVDEKGRAYGTGRRKCSVARVFIQPGNGQFTVNQKEFDVYFPILDHRAALLRPFFKTKTLGLWDVDCTVKGGGVSGQVGAIQLGISRALQNWEPGLRSGLREAGLLTRDPRVVERKKPGKAKARKSFQWVKR